MFGNKNGFDEHARREAAQSVFMSSVEGLANVGAVVVTFFLAPILFDKTIPLVRRFAEAHYIEGISDLMTLVWFVISAVLVFFIARASLSTVLVMGGLALAVRLF